MKQSIRLSKLLELVSDRGGLTVAEAEGLLGVSGATIRRDFEHLASQQLIIRSRGGALPVIGQPITLQYRAAKGETSLQGLAAKAASSVPIGATVGLNASAGAAEVARVLAARADLNAVAVAGSGATVVTNATNIAHELMVRRHLTVMLTGGMARPQSYALMGPITRSALKGISLDVAILGVAGVDARRGVTQADPESAEIDGLFVERADTVIVVATAEQIGSGGLARVCRIEAIDELVTDAALTLPAIRTIRDAGVRIVSPSV